MENTLANITFRFERSTKNKHRYTAVDPQACVSEIYISKLAMPQPMGEVQITIAIHKA